MSCPTSDTLLSQNKSVVQRAAGGTLLTDIGGQGLLGLLRQVQPRGAVILGCAMLAMAGVAAAVVKDHNGALAFGAPGALLIAVGGVAWLARRSAQQPAPPNPATTIAALCWLALYAGTLVVILTEPAILHRAFGVETFGVPIEYVVPAALLLLFLPLWPGFMGLASMLRQAMQKGRGGLLGILRETRSALASADPAERRMAFKALWFFAYFVLLVGAWIAYAEMIGVGLPPPSRTHRPAIHQFRPPQPGPRCEAVKPLRSVADLSRAGLVPPEQVPDLDRVADRYAVAITPEMVGLIDCSDPDDPIARQFVPDARELHHLPEERADPLGEERLSPVPGVVHRYPDRVLLKLTHVCPVYCRFCFRREVVGPGGPQALSGGALDTALGYIAADPRIWEVILTGGDPFMLSPRRVAEVTRRLSSIDNVKILRWHTRVPIADPGRVTEGLARALRSPPRAVYVVVHANHPREITAAVRASLGRLRDAGISLLSQTVLLRGVNDDAATLEALLRALAEVQVKPYYLHHPDLAPGTSHFRLSIEEGQRIVRKLRGRLSGLAQPTYVLDIPGGHGKVPVGPVYLDDGGRRIADPGGTLHDYPERG